jgi:hypothetical protein
MLPEDPNDNVGPQNKTSFRRRPESKFVSAVGTGGFHKNQIPAFAGMTVSGAVAGKTSR